MSGGCGLVQAQQALKVLREAKSFADVNAEYIHTLHYTLRALHIGTQERTDLEILIASSENFIGKARDALLISKGSDGAYCLSAGTSLSLVQLIGLVATHLNASSTSDLCTVMLHQILMGLNTVSCDVVGQERLSAALETLLCLLAAGCNENGGEQEQGAIGDNIPGKCWMFPVSDFIEMFVSIMLNVRVFLNYNLNGTPDTTDQWIEIELKILELWQKVMHDNIGWAVCFPSFHSNNNNKRSSITNVYPKICTSRIDEIKLNETTQSAIVDNTERFTKSLEENLNIAKTNKKFVRVYGGIWRIWAWLLYKCEDRDFQFTSCCVKKRKSVSLFILNPVSLLLKVGGLGKISTEHYSDITAEVARTEAQLCLSLCVQILGIVYSNLKEDEVNEALGILLPYQFYKNKHMAMITDDTYTATLCSIQTLLKGAWPYAELVLGMSTGGQSLNDRLKCMISSEEMPSVLNCHKISMAINCYGAVMPLSEICFTKSKKGIFGHEKGAQLFTRENFAQSLPDRNKRPSKEVLLERLQRLVHAFKSVIPIIRYTKYYPIHKDISDISEYMSEVVSNLTYAWQICVGAIGFEMIECAEQECSDNPDDERTLNTQVFTQEADKVLYSARTPEMNDLHAIHSTLVQLFHEFFLQPETQLNDLEIEFNAERAMIVETFWWILHRSAGFNVSDVNGEFANLDGLYEQTSKRFPYINFDGQECGVRQEKNMLTAALTVTILHNFMAYDCGNFEYGGAFFEGVITKARNCIVQTSNFYWLFQWLIYALKNCGGDKEYDNDAIDTYDIFIIDIKTDLQTGNSTALPVIDFLAIFLRACSIQLANLERDSIDDIEKMSTHVDMLVPTLRSAIMAPFLMIQYGLGGVSRFFGTEEAWKTWECNIVYMFDLENHKPQHHNKEGDTIAAYLLTDGFVDSLRPRRSNSYLRGLRGTSAYDGICVNDIRDSCRMVEVLTKVTIEKCEHVEQKQNCIKISMNVYLSLIVSFWQTYEASSCHKISFHKDPDLFEDGQKYMFETIDSLLKSALSLKGGGGYNPELDHTWILKYLVETQIVLNASSNLNNTLSSQESSYESQRSTVPTFTGGKIPLFEAFSRIPLHWSSCEMDEGGEYFYTWTNRVFNMLSKLFASFEDLRPDIYFKLYVVLQKVGNTIADFKSCCFKKLEDPRILLEGSASHELHQLIDECTNKIARMSGKPEEYDDGEAPETNEGNAVYDNSVSIGDENQHPVPGMIIDEQLLKKTKIENYNQRRLAFGIRSQS